MKMKITPVNAESNFSDQLDLLLKYSRIRTQDALARAVHVAGHTISTWRGRGLPIVRRIPVSEAFAIPPEWLDEPLERFRALVIERFAGITTASFVESPFIQYVSASRAGVPSRWRRRPQLAVNSLHKLTIDVPGMIRTHGRVLTDVIVLSFCVGGIALLRPSSDSSSALALSEILQIPEGGGALRMDAVGKDQAVAVIGLSSPLPPEIRIDLWREREEFIVRADLVPLWEHMNALSDFQVLKLKHTVDVVPAGLS